MRHWTKDIIPLEAAGTLDGLFRERVRRTPDSPAYRGFDSVRGAWTDTTWAEMAQQVARWQAALAGEGLEPGARVAVMLRNCREWTAFDQAALGLGLVTVPLYPDDRAENVAYILEHSGVQLLVLADAAHWQRLGAAHTTASLRRVVLLEGPGLADPDARVRCAADWLGPASPMLREGPGDPHRLASIVYTSGTTGRPKGVMLSHRNMLAVAHGALQLVDGYREDVFLSFLPLSHTLERTAGYYLPMMAGSTVAYARSVPQLAEDLRQVRPTVLIAVPRIFERVHARLTEQLATKPWAARWLFARTEQVGWRRFEARQGRGRRGAGTIAWPLLERLVARKILAALGGRLRIAVSGGAALPVPVARRFLGLGLTLLQGYGLTETAPVVSVNTPHDNDPASVGLPLPGVEVRIGPQDELLVRSPGLMLGYWNDPAATAAALDADGWLRTGDQARIGRGRIYITGRIKDILVLSTGVKVAPADMESAIAMDPLIEQVMVVGEGRPHLAALVVLSAERWPALAAELGLQPDAYASLEHAKLHAALLGRIAERLQGFPGYARIRRVAVLADPWSVENGLLTPTLKLRRSAVLERYAAQVEGLYADGPGRHAQTRAAPIGAL
jgi:long-chain acyl-CoA synthetase